MTDQALRPLIRRIVPSLAWFTETAEALEADVMADGDKPMTDLRVLSVKIRKALVDWGDGSAFGNSALVALIPDWADELEAALAAGLDAAPPLPQEDDGYPTKAEIDTITELLDDKEMLRATLDDLYRQNTKLKTELAERDAALAHPPQQEETKEEDQARVGGQPKLADGATASKG